MATTLRVRVEAPRAPIVEKTLEILARELCERAGVEVVRQDQGAQLALSIRSGIGREGFRIEAEGTATSIIGNDERGLLYGVGKYLRGSHFVEGGFTPTSWTGTSVPDKGVRGVYFATHFHNYYHTAPLEAITRYVEELALWGGNGLLVWFDMHHYAGIDDPAAQAMVSRLRAILQAASDVGMSVGLTLLANEAFNTSPPELRATMDGSDYGVELCPSLPEGMAQVLTGRAEVLDAFADLDLDHVCIWPYDQGGCICDQCKPWGGNGFVRTAAAVAKLARERFPRAKVTLSAWEFGWESRGGETEWDAFYAAMAQHPDWCDYVMIDKYDAYPQYALTHGRPGGFPVLNFPEVSMMTMHPWGGYGANPAPAHFQRLWNQYEHLLDGGFAYSEGIFEDLNKVIALQFYWDAGHTAAETLREYAAYEYGPDVIDGAVEGLELMELGMAHTIPTTPGPVYFHLAELVEKVRQLPAGSFETGPIYLLQQTENAERCFELIAAADAGMSARARAAWRWRIVLNRAALDCELAHTGGEPSARSEALFEELNQIYCAHHGADRRVSAPSLAALRRMAENESLHLGR